MFTNRDDEYFGGILLPLAIVSKVTCRLIPIFSNQNQTAMKFALRICCMCSIFFLTSLTAQENRKLDSILEFHRQTNPKVDSLAQIALQKTDDTLKAYALGTLYNIFRYNAPLLSRELAVKELKVSKNIDFNKGMGWGNYHLGAYFHNAAKIDSARHFYQNSLKIHQSTDNKENVAIVLTSIAGTYELEGNYEKAIEMMEESSAILKHINPYNYAITLGDIGNIYVSKGHYKIALEKSLEALKILDTVYDKPWRKADVQRQIGNIELLQKNYENSFNYYSSALKIYMEQEDNVYVANTTNDIGNVLYQKDDYDTAMDYFSKSLKLSREHDISDIEGNALVNLGKVYVKKEDFGKAINHLKSGLAIHRQNNFKSNILDTQNEIARAYLAMDKPNEAIPFLNQTLAYSDSTGFIHEAMNAYKYRAEAYQENGRLQNAISDLKRYQTLNDSIFNITKSQQIEELRTIYETEKKEQQIALQEKEIDLLEQKERNSTLQKILLGFALLLSLLGFYALRQKMKRNKVEKDKVDAELAFKRKELTTHALHLAKKNETLENLKQKAEEFKASSENNQGYSQLIRTINFDLQDDNNWENFSKYFKEVHKDFNTNVKTKFPEVTSNELRLMALLKMNLSSKEIANILNISPEGIKKARYRLRKKLDITSEESLQDLVLSL